MLTLLFYLIEFLKEVSQVRIELADMSEKEDIDIPVQGIEQTQNPAIPWSGMKAIKKKQFFTKGPNRGILLTWSTSR